MVFFTTPELLEIGDIPFSSANTKPTRQEALEYYRKVTEHYHLHVCQYQWVKTVTEDGRFSYHDNGSHQSDSRPSCEGKSSSQLGITTWRISWEFLARNFLRFSTTTARSASLLPTAYVVVIGGKTRRNGVTRSVATWIACNFGASRMRRCITT